MRRCLKTLLIFRAMPKAITAHGTVFYSGKYQVLINVPLAIASSIAASSTGAYRRLRQRKARGSKAADHDGNALCHGDRISLRSWDGWSLHPPISTTAFWRFVCACGRNADASGAPAIIVFSLSTLSNGLLQGMNRMKEPIKNAVIALILHLFVLVGLMLGADLNIFAVVIANMVFGLLMCILNARSMHRLQRLSSGDQKDVPCSGNLLRRYGDCCLADL